jgi:hypothetical protein
MIGGGGVESCTGQRTAKKYIRALPALLVFQYNVVWDGSKGFDWGRFEPELIRYAKFLFSLADEPSRHYIEHSAGRTPIEKRVFTPKSTVFHRSTHQPSSGAKNLRISKRSKIIKLYILGFCDTLITVDSVVSPFRKLKKPPKNFCIKKWYSTVMCVVPCTILYNLFGCLNVCHTQAKEIRSNNMKTTVDSNRKKKVGK